MKRRTFVQNSGLLLSVSLLPTPLFSSVGKPKYKMGLQAFTIRDALANDLVRSLKTVKALGYADLELCGFDAKKITYYGYKAKDFKQLLDDLGLSSSSCHYGFTDYVNTPKEELSKFVDRCFTGALTLNNSYITWPWMISKKSMQSITDSPDFFKKNLQRVL